MNSAEGLFGALRNGTKFDTRRFAKDIQLFQRNASQVGGSSKALVSAPLPLIHFGETTEETGLPETGKKRSRDRLTRRPGEAGVRPSRGKKTKAFGESQTEGDEADGEEEMAVIGSISRKRNAGGDTKATRKERRKVRQRSLSAAQASGLAGTRDEENNRFRKELQIKVSGGLAPPPIRRFEELRAGGACSPWLLRKIHDKGYAAPTAIQSQAIPALLQGRELLACAPTGSGKTMAFVLPMLIKIWKLGGDFATTAEEGLCVHAVVVSPTLELAKQIKREIKSLVPRRLRVGLLTKATLDGIVSCPPQILVATPQRLCGILSAERLVLGSVRFLFLDEADKLMGDDMLEQIDAIVASCTHPDLQKALFSATLPEKVEELARSVMPAPLRVFVGATEAASVDVEQRLVFAGTEETKLQTLRSLLRQGIRPPVLIFVESKDRAKQLYKELMFDNLRVDVIHSERSKAQRDSAIEEFRLGKTWVLIATDLLGRGMDFKGVNVVINFDIPQSRVSYIHRVGRSGRAGKRGEAITLYSEDDTHMLRTIANVIVASGGEVPDWMLRLPKRESKQQFEQRRKREDAAIEATTFGQKKGSKRAGISTVSKYDLWRARRKKQIIRNSKALRAKDREE